MVASLRILKNTLINLRKSDKWPTSPYITYTNLSDVSVHALKMTALKMLVLLSSPIEISHR